MPGRIPEEFIELKGEIVDSMLAYMERDDEEDFDPGYSQQDVDKCAAILQDYLVAVFRPSVHGDAEQIMAAVKAVVIALNDLNEDCDHGLIETDQREQLCELIINAAGQAGLEAGGEDITGEWREW